MNIVIPGNNRYFRMDIESDDSVILLPSYLALKEVANRHLLIATVEWYWNIKNDVVGTRALTGISEGLLLDIKNDFKEEIENHLHIERGDIIYIAYDHIAKTEIDKDAQGKRIPIVTEYVIPRFIINARTDQAVFLDNEIMEEF